MARSDQDELHLSSSQFNQITIFQGNRINANGHTVEGWIARPFNMVNHETMLAPSNGSHGNSRLADGGDNLSQWNFTARRSPRQNFDRGP